MSKEVLPIHIDSIKKLRDQWGLAYAVNGREKNSWRRGTEMYNKHKELELEARANYLSLSLSLTLLLDRKKQQDFLKQNPNV